MIVYVLSTSSYLAVYVTSSVTFTISLSQPINVYEYCSFDALSVLPSNEGNVPYSYSSFVSCPSTFHVTVYLFTVDVYVAVYVAAATTFSTTVGVHPANVYVNSASAFLLGSAGTTTFSL